jgi:hypothetical protein
LLLGFIVRLQSTFFCATCQKLIVFHTFTVTFTLGGLTTQDEGVKDGSFVPHTMIAIAAPVTPATARDAHVFPAALSLSFTSVRFAHASSSFTLRR